MDALEDFADHQMDALLEVARESAASEERKAPPSTKTTCIGDVRTVGGKRSADRPDYQEGL